MSLDRRFPSIDDLERAARHRMPHFAAEYLYGGIGREVNLDRNRASLDKVHFDPSYLPRHRPAPPEMGKTLFGRHYDLPFGVSPLGLSGLMWPRAVEIMARAAVRANIPMGLSHHATTHMRDFHEIAGENGWMQIYPPHDAGIRRAMLREMRDTGFEVLIVTVDIPRTTRRARELRVELSVPPRVGVRSMLQVAARPRWALETLAAGIPRFHNFRPYLPKGLNLQDEARALLDMIDGAVSQDVLKDIRDHWPGKMIVKGLMNPGDALAAIACGADAVWVSNHGGRQLDAAFSPAEALPGIRAACGPDVPILVDSGPRTGLDIARMLALGADFVFLGRAFIFAVGALGAKGGDHAIHILREELRGAMGQIGAEHPGDLAKFLVEQPNQGH